MLQKTLKNNWAYLLLLAFLILLPFLVQLITGDSVFGVGGRPRGQAYFWQQVFIELYIYAILAMSYNLMFGFTGVISFGHALFVGLGGYTSAILLGKLGFVEAMTGILQPYSDWMIGSFGFAADFNAAITVSYMIAVLLALILSALVGLGMGLVTLRLKGVYFAIFTLALNEMVLIFVGRWAFTQAEDGFSVSTIPDFLNSTQNRLFYYYIVLAITVLVFLLIRRLVNSPTGRVLLAIRENEDRAQSIGFDTLRYKLLSIVIASVMAALAGILLFTFNKRVGAEMFGARFTIQPLLMTIIGGIGSFSGPVIGATLLDLSEEFLNREFVFGDFVFNLGQYWSLLLGIIFIVVVLIFPQGIVGTVQKQWTKWRNPPKD